MTPDSQLESAQETQYVRSADGTRIAFESHGSGLPIIFISGILSDRSSLANLAMAVAQSATSIIFDRRGRGDSDPAGRYEVAREVDDISAIISLLEAPPVLFGHSSGAGLAIEAAAAQLPIGGLILYEPPYGQDDPESREESAAFARAIELKLAAGENSQAVATFFEAMGLTPEEVEALAADPAYIRLAPTMAHDFAVMGQVDLGGVIPTARVGRIAVPTLVLTGENSPDFFSTIAVQVAEAITDAALETVQGGDHTAQSEHLPAVVLGFLNRIRRGKA